MVLWQEFDRENSPLDVKYVEVDGKGNPVGAINRISQFVLSECDPILMDGKLVWFADKKGKRIFYTIPL
ncbi:hypothetical protein D3C76_1840860 [compost metagenome]